MVTSDLRFLKAVTRKITYFHLRSHAMLGDKVQD